MSVWRRKAIECLPDLKSEFEKPETTIYTVFFDLLPATRDAHRNNETEKLKQYYEFAEWCFAQKDQELINAAGVAFYEHLGDSDETFFAMPNWVSKNIYKEIRGLLELRLDNEKMKKLDDVYFGIRGKR